MKYKPYPKYKPSGIDWIGDIPEGWEKEKLKYWVNLINESEESEVEKFLVDLENIESFTGKLLNEIESSGKGMKRFVSGDVLFNKLRPYLAKVFYGGKDGCCGGEFLVLRPKDEIVPKFLFYRVLSIDFINLINNSSYGVKMPRANWDYIGSIFLPYPNQKEQRDIVSYLDKKTAQIDDLIQKKEEMIKLLKEKRSTIINQAVTKGLDPNAKMKPSGIDWIGDISEGWGIRRLKFLSKIISKGTTPSTIGREILSDGNIRFLKAENIQEGEIQKYPEFFIDEETNKLLKRSELKEEDILFVIAGATIGKAGLLKKKFLPANTNQAVSFVRLVKGVNKKFILYWLQSVYIKKLTWLNAVQSAQPNLSMESLGDFAIPYPGTKEEQQQITNYLDEKTETMDSLIQKIDSAIAKLREYRSSLITAAVTGKIDVRGAVKC